MTQTHDTPVKLCECGCGRPAPIATKTRTKLGHVKGQPIRFIRGHCGTLGRGIPKTGITPAKRATKVCAYCGESFDVRWAVRNRATFCSVRCRELGRTGRTLNGDALIDNGDGTMSVPLGRGLTALIDTADRALVEHWRWTSSMVGRRIYAVHRAGAASVPMHRVLMGAPDELDVDHIDGNGLNNCRSNLRLATRSENMANVPVRRSNTSGFTGVSRHSVSGRWRATIKQDGRQVHIGFFDTPEDAARAYDARAREVFGAFARLNLPDDHEHPLGERRVRDTRRLGDRDT